MNPPHLAVTRLHSISYGQVEGLCLDNTFLKWVILNCPDIPNRLNISWLLSANILSSSFFFCSNCWLIDSNGSSPDSLQGGRWHTTAHLWGVSDNNAAHSLIGWLVLAVPRGHGCPAAGAGHPLKGLCSALRGAVPAEDGSRGPQAG